MRNNGKREKWVEEFHLKYPTATSHIERKLREVIIIKECNTQKGKQQKRAGIPIKREGSPVEVEGKRDTTRVLGNLNHSRVGFRQPTSSGG